MAKKKKLKDYPYYPSMTSKKKRLSGIGRVITLDTEAIGLLPDLRPNDPSSQHVIVCRDRESGETFVFFDPYEKRDPKNRVWLDEWEGEQDGFLYDAVKFINETDVIVCQNWLGYDHHAIAKVHGKALKVNWKAKPRNNGGHRTKEYPFRVMDTLVMSQLLNPERKPPKEAYAMDRGNVGPHSIEAHGMRIGRFKPENEDWSHLTDHMIHRCWEDVAIGDDLYDYLMDEWHEQSAPNPVTGLSIVDAYRMEAVMYYQMAAQAARGFRLDIYWAWQLVKKLDKHKKRILKNAMPHMPLRLTKSKLNKDAMRNSIFRAHTITPKQRKKLLKWLDKSKFTHGASRMTNWNFITQTGNYSANTKKDFPEYAVGNIGDYRRSNQPTVIGPYTPVSFEEITLGNRDIVRQTLHELGWRGVNLTNGEQDYVDEHGELPYYYAGKLDEDSIKAWKERGEPPKWAIDILEYYVVQSRRGQILNEKDMAYYAEHKEWPKQQNGKRECRGLVPRARCSSTGKEFQEFMEEFGLDYWNKKQWGKDDEFRVPAEAFAIGTNTFRMRHKYVVNIPSRGLYGHEMRKLFIASEGWSILGCDGSGLELRMLSHFMRDPDYEHQILEGDIHSYNQEKAGLDERDHAKTFIYAFLYGSGIANLALVCGYSIKKMQEKVDEFLASLPLLKNLIEGVQGAAVKKGYLKAVDGRWGRVRKQGGEVKTHTALNVLLQMTGSLCMKWGLYIALEMFEELGIPARLVANVHDEVQMEVKTKEVEHIQYKIKSSEWKAEEKKQMKRKDGMYWSAPVILGEDKKGRLIIQRDFHQAGDVLMKAFTKAGEYLSIRTPLAGEYKIGDSWAKTH